MQEILDESILDSMLQDPRLVELYGENSDRELIRQLLSDKGEAYCADLPEELPESGGEEGEDDGLRLGNIRIALDEDAMTARISLTKPGNGELDATADDIRRALRICGIVAGINETYVNRLAATPIYSRSFIIASGKAPADGTPNKIIYYFEQNKDLHPKETADGQVNYLELDFAQTVKKGDLLCELIPGEDGVNGYTVTGQLMIAVQPGDCKIMSGQNTELSDDATRLFAACDGEVSIRAGKVIVDKVLRVPEVGPMTGNIRFIGSLHVSGRIREGFMAKVTGNIYVGEVIEGAEVSADGDVQVAHGIKGANKGSIRVGGNLRTFFIENMNVSVKGDIFSDAIMTSQVECGGKVSAMGKNGKLIGGTCKAMEIDAMEIGNDSLVRTELEITGIDNLEKEIRKAGNNLKLLDVAERQLQLQLEKDSAVDQMKTKKDLVAILYQKNRLAFHVSQLEQEIRHKKACYSFHIKARAILYPNVYVKMGALSYTVKNMEKSCALIMNDNHIVMRRRRHEGGGE